MSRKMKRFKLHWLDGSKNIVQGDDITSAVNSAGFGAGSIGALDYWEQLKQDNTPANSKEN
ncbi:hypothetical protein KAR91_50455 [Candidatus Pacearchaeota archaeon]|nr:hypothetical protein [Candidatus Pacearchaeota archaeon]